MKIRPLTVLMAVLLVFSLGASGLALCDKRAPLFKIERNKNKNVVQYDACLGQNNNISESNPVHAYWVLENGQKEGLSIVESRKAYGIISKEKLDENKFRIVLAALKNRNLIVQKIKGRYRALTQISNELSILERVYVQSEEKTPGLPKVQRVDLYGRSFKTNRSVKERITPN